MLSDSRICGFGMVSKHTEPVFLTRCVCGTSMLYRLLLSLPSLVFKGHSTATAFLASLFRRDNRLWYVPSQGGLLSHSTKTDSYRYHVHMRRPFVTRKPTHIGNLKVVVIHSQVLHRKREQFAGMRVFFFTPFF